VKAAVKQLVDDDVPPLGGQCVNDFNSRCALRKDLVDVGVKVAHAACIAAISPDNVTQVDDRDAVRPTGAAQRMNFGYDGCRSGYKKRTVRLTKNLLHVYDQKGGSVLAQGPFLR